MQHTIYYTGADGYEAASIVTADTTQEAIEIFTTRKPDATINRTAPGNPFAW